MLHVRSTLLLATLVLSLDPALQDGAKEDLAGRIEAVRVEAKVPALAGALVTADGGLEGVWVAGTRRAGGEERVTADDLWHIGSCTKSMTSTLIALLVARGDLSWDAVLGDLLPDIAEEMGLDYTGVTLVELMSHRAGLPNDLNAELAGLDFSRPVVELRDQVTRIVLKHPPVHTPRGTFLYSNFGFLIAGHVAEVAAKKPWETLMQELLFTPLGMTSAGFGAPGTPERCDQPRGHLDDGTPVEPGPDADNPALLGPAGTVHASLADWAKFVRLHLEGERGDMKVGALTLTRDAFALLHQPYELGDAPPPRYALGWGVEQRDWAGGDGTALWHNGSNTLWYCVAWLGPGNGVAALVTTNAATPAAKGATDKVAGLLIEEFERRRAGASGD
jgi:D-alanyl-D-alanine carboxypeptidase